jgi:subtilisin family serine protease
MKRNSVLLFTIILFALVISSALPQARSAAIVKQEAGSKFRRSEKRIPNHYIVVFNEDVSRITVAALTAELSRLYGGKVEHIYESALKGFSVELAEPIAIALSQDPRIDHITEDAEVSLSATQFNPPWNLDRIDQRDLPLDGVYTYNTTGAGVNVYIIDTGIRPTHQEFGGRAFIAADFVGDGQNGNDCNGHGTHVAGTIGGSTYGVAKGATLYAVRVFSCSGGSPFSTIIAGVNWVTANHVSPAICNMSLGGTPPFPDLDTAVSNSIGSGVTYTIAAGNGTNNDCIPIDASNVSPARVATALTVSATDISDNRFSCANYGSVVDVFAPGVDVTSAWWFSDTATNTISGTSMAAPHVAGVAALYLQNNPGASPGTISAAVTSNASVGKVINPGSGTPNRLLYSIFAPSPPSAGQPVPADYDGDGRADLSMKMDDGRWLIDYASNGFGAWDATYSGYGGVDSHPVPRDYDGDGRADLSVKSDGGAWSIDYSSNGFGAIDATYYGYGGAESRPAPADYDGDGRADLCVHNTSTGQWRIDYAYDGYGYWNFNWGGYGFSENRETPADYDGDGRADIGIHSITQGRWNIDYAWNGFGTWNASYGGYGFAENREVPADYDGDGRADIAVRADNTQTWFIDYAWNGFGTWNVSYAGYGGADSIPVPADYDGDGRADLSIKTSDGRWLIDYASNGFGAFDQTIVLQ